MPCAIHPKTPCGFILISVLSFILLTSLSIAAILNMTVTQIRILGSEKSHLENFRLSEQKLINAEKLISEGVDTDHLVGVEPFRPKNFRSKAGISSEHFKLTATTDHQHGQTKLQSIIRVDAPKEKPSSSKKASIQPRKNERTVHRLEWKKP
jgi:Tfp pilus assembly protein PilX